MFQMCIVWTPGAEEDGGVEQQSLFFLNGEIGRCYTVTCTFWTKLLLSTFEGTK